MLALALQQEDATSRDSASGPTSRALSVSHPPTSTRSRDHLDQNQSLRVASGDEAVALALHQKEQALFEQWERPRQASPSPFPVESQPEPGRDELIRQPHVERRAPRDRDRYDCTTFRRALNMFFAFLTVLKVYMMITQSCLLSTFCTM